MGKGKPKKGKPTVIGEEFPQPPHEPTCTCSHEPLKAADGHNVDGWTDEDIRIYNELLNERAKLEKEKSELEQKSARHHTERALLNEDFAALENPFKPQLGGEYKFTGQGSCCLDHVSASTITNHPTHSCTHEICTRAKSKGISWMEMDTIRYYQARIASEKSQRMQSALRKQRDVELTRVKKDDEEDIAIRARKSAIFDKGLLSSIDGTVPTSGQSSTDLISSVTENLAASTSLLDSKNTAILEAAKENELVVRRIRTRLDKIRHDVNTGKITPFDARSKLEQANKEMAEAERKNNAFRQMIWNAEPSRDQLSSTGLSQALTKSMPSSTGDAFSQALNVMKGFFSASDPRDVQSAITDLRSVLKINGPMSPVLQKSFQALEEMLAKPNAKGFSVDLTNSDGSKRTCTNVVDVLLSLRQTGQDSNSLGITAEDLKLDKATMQSNDECAKIEAGAMKEMEKELELQRQPDAKTLLQTLLKIKEKAVMASPIPPLTDIVLDRAMNELMYQAMAKILMQQAREGATERDLAGKITSQIISLSHRKPERYMDIHNKLLTAIKLVAAQSNVVALHQAVANVGLSMQQFVDKYREKEKKEQSLQTEQQLQSGNLSNSEQLDRLNTSEPAKLQTGQGGLVPTPLQVRKHSETETIASSSKVASGGLNFPAWTGDDSIRLSQSLLQQGEMLKSTGIMELLQGMNTGDLVNMLCGLEPGADPRSQDSSKLQLKQDLTHFLSMPTGQEDAALLRRVQIAFENIAQQEAGTKHKPSKTKPHSTSKFLEDLPSEQSSPPPYQVDHEHSRQAKMKKVSVNTPNIHDGTHGTAQQSCVCGSDAALSQIENAAKKSLHMGNEISSMHAELMKLMNAPGADGRKARYTRAKLDSLQQELTEAAAKAYRELEKTTMPQELIEDVKASLAAMENLGTANKDKGKSRGTGYTNNLENPAHSTDGRKDLISKGSRKKQSKPQSTNGGVPNTATDVEAVVNTANPQSTASSTESMNISGKSPMILNDREQMIKDQLSRLATNLDNLSQTRSSFSKSSQQDAFGFETAFSGIYIQLEEQMLGHIEMAWHVSTANDWTGLKTWLRECFGKIQP